VPGLFRAGFRAPTLASVRTQGRCGDGDHYIVKRPQDLDPRWRQTCRLDLLPGAHRSPRRKVAGRHFVLLIDMKSPGVTRASHPSPSNGLA